MSDLWVLDAYCGAGGATKGYQRAGFKVLGVDIQPQPNYCGDEFVQADAITYLRRLLDKLPNLPFVGAHASAPCQAFTAAQRIMKNDHPDLVKPTRDLLIALGLPYVMENVPGAPLRDPVMLCGAMFPELRVYRHRLFEASFPLPQPEHPEHVAPQVKMGRRPKPGEWIQVVGNFSGVAEAREAMGIDWMTRNELSEAIPPAYTEWVGRRLMDHINDRKEMAA